MKKLTLGLFVSLFTIGTVATIAATSSPAGACIDVIQPAINPATGECREFNTPCQVPKGWVKVAACPAAQ